MFVQLQIKKRLRLWIVAVAVLVLLNVGSFVQFVLEIRGLNLSFADSTITSRSIVSPLSEITDPSLPDITDSLQKESLSLFRDFLLRDTNFTRLPPWYHDYVDWHHNTLEQLNETNWSDYQYVLLRCVQGDDKCYGTSDRLKMVPVMLLMAAQTRRLFFIHWSRPARLEEFLIPNQINWTLPEWLHPLIDSEAVFPIWKMGLNGTIGMYNVTDEQIIRIKSMVYANSYYNEQISNDAELPLWDIYHEFWQALFLPSLPVQERIVSALQDLDLLSEEDGTVRPYVSVHVRANYVTDTTDSKEEENAIRCASRIQQELAASREVNRADIPIYMAADAANVIQNAMEYGQDWGVVGRPIFSEDPWHLDQREGRPEQFYDTFVDLYLLSLGECYTWGRGGYGSWAAVMGHFARSTCPSSRTHFQTKCAFAEVATGTSIDA